MNMKTFSSALGLIVLVAACGGHASPTGGGVPEGGNGANPDSYTVTFGPIQVPAGVENTQCIVKRLGNAASIHVGQIHDVLGNSSHHMVLYKVDDTTEQLAPYDCTPFVDTLNPAHGNPLIISQKLDDLLSLPPGVAFTLDANQMVRLEMHYINATPQAETLESTSTLTMLPDGQYQYDASFLFIGDLDVQIPPMAKATLGPIYYPVPAQFAQSNFFAITGHEHHWGTDVQVWTATSATDPGTPVYQVPNWSWSDPKLQMMDPPLKVPAGGGFKFQCDWFNQSASPVSFGESAATNEMCFFWAYYYPSQGAEVCFHTDRGGGIDQCCPGSALCSQLGN